MTQMQTHNGQTNNGPQTYSLATLSSKIASPEFIAGMTKMLPDAMKPHAERFVSQAKLFFMQKPDLLSCTPASIIRSIQAAAELGFALDGRLAYGIKYGNELTMQLDYKAVLAVVKRCGAIKSAVSYVVYENDEFDWKIVDGTSVLTHRPFLGQDRGEAIGAYACFKTPTDDVVVEYMSVHEIEQARSCSKARNSMMWTKFWSEGAKKTVLKRGLKMFQEDPAIQAAVEADDDFDRDAMNTPLVRVESKPAVPQGRVNTRAQVSPPVVAPNVAAQPQPQQAAAPAPITLAEWESRAMNAKTQQEQEKLRAEIVRAVDDGDLSEDDHSRLYDMIPVLATAK